jgi:hypothetical protein
MAIKIEKKITGYGLVSEEDKAKDAAASAQAATSNVVQMGEPLTRPEKLVVNT